MVAFVMGRYVGVRMSIFEHVGMDSFIIFFSILVNYLFVLEVWIIVLFSPEVSEFDMFILKG